MIMEKLRENALLAIVIWMMSVTTAMAQQQELSVSVHVDEPGTLFVKIMEQIEELGETTDITSLTVSGRLNEDDRNVLRNQTPNVVQADFSGVEADCAKYILMCDHKHLRSCILPTEAEELGNDLFYGCDSLVSIAMPPRLKTIPDYFVEQCPMLPNVDIPATVTAIGTAAFESCYALTAIQLPDGLTTLGSRAFSECKLLTEVTIPAGVTEIQSQTFKNCISLKTIRLLCTDAVLRYQAFSGTGIETFTLPKGIRIDGDEVFGSCPYLRSFTFSDGLTTKNEIGTSTLWNDTALVNVRLPQDLTVIPEYFFKYTAISSIDLPTTVTTIGKDAFAYCKKLAAFTIQQHVTTVDEAAFHHSGLQQFTWPDHLTTIKQSMFEGCDQLTAITIPATVDSLQSRVFYDCRMLERISLPGAVRTIPDNCFQNCDSLREVILPPTVNYISWTAFGNCKSLRHIDLPDAITYIGPYAFASTPLEELRLPAQLKIIDTHAFIGGCYRHVTVPEGVIRVENRAFGSDSLKCVDYPSTLLYIGDNPFNDNPNPVDSLIMRAAIPPYHGEFFSRWGNEHKTTFFVPKNSLSLYQSDPYFSRAEQFATLDIESTLLNIADAIVIDQNSGLQQAKYDVVFSSLNNMGYSVNRDPSLTIADGATLHARTFTMSHLLTSYTPRFDTFINNGTFTVDHIDLRCQFYGRALFTPPFDVRISDLYTEFGLSPFAFFRYDGAARAAAQFDKSWTRVAADETLHAGTTYVVRMERVFDYSLPRDRNGYAQRVWDYLHLTPAAGGANYLVGNADVSLPLQHYPSEFDHNKSWNALGMPYTSYFDIRGIDYDGPILVWNFTSADYDADWNGRTGAWKAYSALDDEVVLNPMSAFFLQAPDGVDALSLSADRRQTTRTFVKGDTQNSSRALRRADKRAHRMVFNVMLSRDSDTEELDRTRFVINPQATTRYDIGRDAPKMSDDEGPATLLYTVADGLAYAINERPLADGIVRLGLQLAEPGTYSLTFSIAGAATTDGADAADAVLIDQLTGSRTPLTEPYAFTADEAGTLANRFVVAFGTADPTAIADVSNAAPIRSEGIFNLNGQRISTPRKGLYIENGQKVIKQ